MLEKLGFFARRLKEPSSWAGISVLAYIAGVTVPQFTAFSTAAAGICGLIAVLIPENGKVQDEK